MPKRGGPVHLAKIKTKGAGDRVYVSHLLRRSYRPGASREPWQSLPPARSDHLCDPPGLDGRDLGLGGEDRFGIERPWLTAVWQQS